DTPLKEAVNVVGEAPKSPSTPCDGDGPCQPSSSSNVLGSSRTIDSSYRGNGGAQASQLLPVVTRIDPSAASATLDQMLAPTTPGGREFQLANSAPVD